MRNVHEQEKDLERAIHLIEDDKKDTHMKKRPKLHIIVLTVMLILFLGIIIASIVF
ncbi:MAG: hypothetical protein ACNA7U_05950 [Candidatus Izemoplasmataceae bacterium]|jgi:hypothetical protein|uniref:hypothetical protein n=1 Tax=Liberiplasma polymorphum TaxID=3374570 RepID=UPI0037738FD5